MVVTLFSAFDAQMIWNNAGKQFSTANAMETSWEGNFCFLKEYINLPKYCRYSWKSRANWENNVIHHLSKSVNTLNDVMVIFILCISRKLPLLIWNKFINLLRANPTKMVKHSNNSSVNCQKTCYVIYELLIKDSDKTFESRYSLLILHCRMNLASLYRHFV